VTKTNTFLYKDYKLIPVISDLLINSIDGWRSSTTKLQYKWTWEGLQLKVTLNRKKKQ